MLWSCWLVDKQETWLAALVRQPIELISAWYITYSLANVCIPCYSDLSTKKRHGVTPAPHTTCHTPLTKYCQSATPCTLAWLWLMSITDDLFVAITCIEIAWKIASSWLLFQSPHYVMYTCSCMHTHVHTDGSYQVTWAHPSSPPGMRVLTRAMTSSWHRCCSWSLTGNMTDW